MGDVIKFPTPPSPENAWLIEQFGPDVVLERDMQEGEYGPLLSAKDIIIAQQAAWARHPRNRDNEIQRRREITARMLKEFQADSQQ